MLAALLTLSTLLLATGGLPLGLALSGLLLIWISATPLLGYFHDDALRLPVPFAPAIGLYYVVFFGIPIFLTHLTYRVDERVVLYFRVVLEPTSPAVLLLATAGISLFFFAFYGAKATVLARLPRFRMPRLGPDGATLNILYVVLLVASLVYHHSAVLRSLPSIGQFLDPAGYVGLGGLYLQWRAGRLPRSWAWILLLVALPADVLWRMRYLFITDIILLLMFFSFVLWRERQFRFLIALVALGSVVAITYSATTAVRHNSDTLIGKLTAVGEYIPRILSAHHNQMLTGYSVGNISYDARVSPLVARIGQIWIFQAVYERSPNPIPYLGGATYKPLLTSFIPRIFYPDKPEERSGGVFGTTYGFTGDAGTSVNIPWMTELLANFGPSGMLFGMAVFGVLLAFLDKLFNAPGMTDLEFLIGLTILFRLCYQESNFSVMTGSLLPLFLCLVLYFWLGDKVIKLARRFRGT